SAILAWEWVSRASRIFSALRVKSSLFFCVGSGMGKVFHPKVLEYRKSVFIFPQTTESHAKCNLDARIDNVKRLASLMKNNRSVTVALFSITPTGSQFLFSELIFGITNVKLPGVCLLDINLCAYLAAFSDMDFVLWAARIAATASIRSLTLERLRASSRSASSIQRQ